ncbi:MAG TPA: NAD(P)/FAD-dependent oxidoreductase [Pyrinomonadaceae bacterium]|nr:NAD(P)/FAD-dependent oxidoreductase [Pyrinomonadaceae bacterium]
MKTETRQRVLILGGGFGGLYTALELEKSLARRAGVEVTLVNRENFFLFTPMLHEVAASDLDFTHIVNPVRKLLRRTKFFQGTVEAVDLEARRVTVSHGAGHRHELEYDYLVVALGAVTNFYDLPGLAERALTMKSLGDAVHLRGQLIKNLEEADFEPRAEDRAPLLTFVVAGGGFAGVETAAAVNDFVREALEFYPRLDKKMLHMVLVEAGPKVLPELGEKLGDYARKKLADAGVEVRLGTAVKKFSEAGVELGDGEVIRTNTLVWTAGISPNPILETLPCRKDRGRLRTDEFMEVEGRPGVWALGDCASVPDVTTGKTCPPTAQHALRQGKTVARNIVASIHGKQKRPFVFKTVGQLASMGRRTGVARILGVNFSGFVAWWLWRTVYLSKLPRFEKKLRVALDWTLDLIFTKDLVQFLTIHSPSDPAANREPRRPASDLAARARVV